MDIVNILKKQKNQLDHIKLLMLHYHPSHPFHKVMLKLKSMLSGRKRDKLNNKSCWRKREYMR